LGDEEDFELKISIDWKLKPEEENILAAVACFVTNIYWNGVSVNVDLAVQRHALDSLLVIFMAEILSPFKLKKVFLVLKTCTFLKFLAEMLNLLPNSARWL